MTTRTILVEGYDKPFRDNVILVILNQDGHVFIGKNKPDHLNCKHPDIWAFPGGAVDKEDRSRDVAALRETLEETGLHSRIVGAFSTRILDIFRDEHPTYAGRALFPYLLFVHDDHKVKLDSGYDHEGATFVEHRFVPLDQTEHCGSDQHRAVYSALRKELAPLTAAMAGKKSDYHQVKELARKLLPDFAPLKTEPSKPWHHPPEMPGARTQGARPQTLG